MDDQPNVTRRKPFGFRPLHSFSLLALLIFVTLAGCGFGWLGFKVREARRQQAAVAAIRKSGGFVAYDYQFDARGGDIPHAIPPGPAWLRSLLGDDFFGNVHTVFLVGENTTDADVERLKEFKALRSLSLHGTQVTDAGLENLAGLTQLTELMLDGTRISDAGLERLPVLTKLDTLLLDGTQVTGPGLDRLQGASHLRFMCLSDTRVTDAGLQHLKELTQLRWLYLDGTQITDAGLENLNGLTQLEHLWVDRTAVTDAGVAKLQKTLPNCVIYRGPSHDN